MANRYVRSTDGNNADDGSTWALADLDGAGSTAGDAAGDTIWFSQAHAESTAAAITWAVAGTLASPSKLLCGNDAAEPPTALATTGTVTTTGNNAITLNGSFYCYGLQFSAGSGANAVALNLATSTADRQDYESCALRLGGTSASTANISLGASTVNQTQVTWINCSIKFSAAGQRIFNNLCGWEWRGGSAESGTSSPTTNGLVLTRGGKSVIDGVDLSNLSASTPLVGGSSSGGSLTIFRNCKLPASWSGTLFTGTLSISARAEMWNCAAGDTNYEMWVEDYAGSIKHETTIVHTGGASDGDTPISWKMASSANAEYPTIILRSPEIFVPNTTTGASKTLTVEIAQDGTTAALNDDEIWLEVEYLGTSGVPLALFANDCKADVLATAAAQANSSESWSGLSGTNKKQALSVTITPQEEGVYIARVCLAKASTTVYVDPKVTVS